MTIREFAWRASHGRTTPNSGARLVLWHVKDCFRSPLSSLARPCDQRPFFPKPVQLPLMGQRCFLFWFWRTLADFTTMWLVVAGDCWRFVRKLTNKYTTRYIEGLQWRIDEAMLINGQKHDTRREMRNRANSSLANHKTTRTPFYLYKSQPFFCWGEACNPKLDQKSLGSCLPWWKKLENEWWGWLTTEKGKRQ